MKLEDLNLESPEVRDILVEMLGENYMEGYVRGIIKGVEIVESYTRQSLKPLKDSILETQAELAAEQAKEKLNEDKSSRDIYRGPDPTRPNSV